MPVYEVQDWIRQNCQSVALRALDTEKPWIGYQIKWRRFLIDEVEFPLPRELRNADEAGKWQKAAEDLALDHELAGQGGVHIWTSVTFAAGLFLGGSTLLVHSFGGLWIWLYIAAAIWTLSSAAVGVSVSRLLSDAPTWRRRAAAYRDRARELEELERTDSGVGLWSYRRQRRHRHKI